ncbi:MAG: hypothetical protein OEZ16_05780 [Chromatiales bacterium]|nr:hypothetical protein [Chromatiales bacterium]
MSEGKLPHDPNGLHFAAGAFIGGVTGLVLTHMGQPQMDAAITGLMATCATGIFKALRDGNRVSPGRALANGALIASGGLITPLLLLF